MWRVNILLPTTLYIVGQQNRVGSFMYTFQRIWYFIILLCEFVHQYQQDISLMLDCRNVFSTFHDSFEQTKLFQFCYRLDSLNCFLKIHFSELLFQILGLWLWLVSPLFSCSIDFLAIWENPVFNFPFYFLLWDLQEW